MKTTIYFYELNILGLVATIHLKGYMLPDCLFHQ